MDGRIKMTTYELALQEAKKYGIEADFLTEPALPSFEIRASGGRLVIAAPNDVELLYGVYASAEKFGGYAFLEPGRDLYRQEDKVTALPIADGVLIPAKAPLLKTRGFIQEFPFDDETGILFDWMAKNGLNYLDTWLKYYDDIPEDMKEAARIRGIEIEPGHHSFNYWIPGEKYARKHPDFMAMINGRRIAPSGNLELLLSEQLCTTNPELREEFVRRMVEYCQAHPEVRTISLIPNDGFGWCECPECSKFYDENAKGDLYSVSSHVYKADRIYHDFLKEVGRKFHDIMPDRRITLCAYVNYCRPAPGMTLDKGMVVSFASYWRCINHAIDDPDCPVNSHYASDILAWRDARNGGEIYIYEYFMGVNFYLSLPMIHFHEMFREVRWYAEQGIDGLYTQFHIPHWTVYGPNYYMMARATRGDDEKETIDNFFRRRFGRDAEQGREFYDAVKKVQQSAGACHIPHPYSLLTRTTLAQYEKLAELAGKLAALEPDDIFRRELVLWTDFLCRFKILFDHNLAGQATETEVLQFLDWIRQQNNTRVFVKNRFEMYFSEVAKILREGRRWIHFGIDWEDQAILQEEKMFFCRKNSHLDGI